MCSVRSKEKESQYINTHTESGSFDRNLRKLCIYSNMIFPQFTSISVVEFPMNIGSYASLLKLWDIEGASKLAIDIQKPLS